MKQVTLSAAIAGALLAVTGFAPLSAQEQGWNWGMGVDEVIAAVNGTKKVKEKKDQRILGAHRLAEGTTEVDGVPFKTAFYFDPATKGLSKVNHTPSVDNCLAARDAIAARLGEGKVEMKSDAILPGRQLLNQENRLWSEPLHGGTINYVSVSFGDDLQYCQILHEA